jgi:hypothetical protein
LYDAGPQYDAISGPLTGGNSTGNTFENGRIVSSYLDLIRADQSGSGFFLQNRTGGGGGPFNEQVWGTITPVVVTPNTLYELSLYLTNENTTTNGRIQPTINTTPIGSAVSATGTFVTHGWQQFKFPWNSGSATTADLSLGNLVSGGGGNDFGIDTITLRRVPEPMTILLFVITAGFMFLECSRRRHRAPCLKE